MPTIWSGFRDALGVTLPTTTETLVFTLPPVSTTSRGASISISGFIKLTTGAGTTAVQLRIRRGTTVTGTVVVMVPVSVQAGAQVTIPFTVQDAIGEVAGQRYVITLQQVGATGNGSADTVGVVIIAE